MPNNGQSYEDENLTEKERGSGTRQPNEKEQRTGTGQDTKFDKGAATGQDPKLAGETLNPDRPDEFGDGDRRS